MTIDEKLIRYKIKVYREQEQQALANANASVGARLACEELLQLIEKGDTDDTLRPEDRIY